MSDLTMLPRWVERLLAPLSEDAPCGEDLRYDAAIESIRAAREADDPTLPMGDWERPLKRADWPAVAEQCTALLAARTKDLQLACWLTEAWLHLHGMAGLDAGLNVVTGLIERYWSGPDGGVHPHLDPQDGDPEARIGPLRWLNKTLPLAMRLDVTLLDLPDHPRERLVLDDWERAVARATRAPATESEDDANAHVPDRDDLMRLAGTPRAREPLSALGAPLTSVRATVQRLNAALDARLGLDAPSLAPMRETLERIERAWNALGGATRPASDRPPGDAPLDAPLDAPRSTIAAPVASNVPPPPNDAPMRIAQMDRAEAYRQLEAIADLLATIEPHSPTPYIVRRAISWGRMPLPQLLKELLRQEGDLNRLFALLGVPVDQD